MRIALIQTFRAVGLFIVLLLWPAPLLAEVNESAADPQQAEGRIVIARLHHPTEREPVCLSDDFLTQMARETDMPIQRKLRTITLADDALFDHPFVIFTGARAFDFNDAQRRRLKTYLQQGGFLLASASCSNAQWASAFSKLMQTLFPDKTWQPIGPNHALRHTLYDLKRIDTRRSSERSVLQGITVRGQLAVVFSPVGVNGTDQAGGGCCCCGGNEVTRPALINANILAYALTH
jgi:hypothetical protein